MLGNPLPLRIDVDVLRSCLQGGFAAHMLHGYGIGIALEADGCLRGDAADFCAAGIVGTPRQRQECPALFLEELRHRMRLSCHLVGGDILLAAIAEFLVQLSQGSDTGDGNQQISSCPTDEVFHESLFVAAPGIAEVRFEAVMCRECRIPLLWYGVLAGSLLDSDPRIVEEDTARCTAEEGQGLYEAFEEGFGVLPAEAHGEGCATVGKAGAEELHFRAFAIQIDDRLAPVDLHPIPQGEKEGDEGLARIAAQFGDNTPYGALGAAEAFFIYEAFIDAPGCMVLLPVRFQAILVQALLDELEDVRGHDACCTAVACSKPWIGVAFAILGHRIAGDTEPLGDLPLTQAVDQIHASNLFVVLYCDYHLACLPFMR